ncbi:MAG: PorT family protein [Bacteroidales bacterium]|nr:PorT family protein [Bacteroidales bacterium]
MYRSICFLALLLLGVQLFAQQRDTVYVTETKIVYDTIVQRDTLFLHDTLHLKEIHSISDTVNIDTAMGQLEGFDWEEQDPDYRAVKNSNKPNPFEGFHLGILMDVGILTPAKLHYDNADYETFIGSNKNAPLKANPGVGGHIGLEFSYHFAKYFGLSAGLAYGTTGAFRYHARQDNADYSLFDYKHFGIYRTGLSMPLKFEFHTLGKSQWSKIWFTASAGLRLRMPWNTFITGYDDDVSSPNSLPGLLLSDESIDPNRLNLDLIADVGLYVQLPHGGLLRWTVGANIAFRDFASGTFSLRLDPAQNVMPSTSTTYENGSFRLRSHMFYTQLAFIQTFQKQKQKSAAKPHWSSDKQLFRHEFKFEVCDPTCVMLFDRYFVYVYPEQLPPNESWRSSGFHSTPVFSVAYHYRAAKWFWLGISLSYAHYRDQQSVIQTNQSITGDCIRIFHTLALMPEVRFSYLNRPHVTLYSALSVGLAQFFGDQIVNNLSYPENASPWCSNFLNSSHFPTEFSTLHVTLFGLKAGWRHWFASLELGAGYKGLGAVGIGYEL